ncbi:MAG: amidohydrolase [Cyclobacteriaceae bacterium]|jgi:predicted amidohydrolase YtcJ
MKVRLFLLLLLALSACKKQHAPADTILTGGTIYTLNDANPTAEAVVVAGDSIVFVGTQKEAEAWRGPETKMVNLNGRTLTPGFIETHGHIMGLGYNELNLDLMDVKSYEELVERVRQAVAKAQPGQWIVGRGWHQDKWDSKPANMVKGFQTHELLSAASPDNPVYLRHASGHAGFANAKAMQIAGVNQLSVEQIREASSEGGEIIRDNLGNPTGIFNERAQSLITRHIPDNTTENDQQALELAMQACARNGITSFHDAGASRSNIDLFHQFKAEGKLTTNLYVMITGFDSELIYDWLRQGPEVDPNGNLTIRSIKLNCDGALGSRGAWLLEEYSDRPGFFGMATLPMDTVMKISREGLKRGFQVCSHAIGDRANKEILDRYEIALNENPVRDHRFRIEHAQHMRGADIPRFGQMGVIAAMQANHLSSDRPWAIDRLGEKRIKEGAYMWQSLLKTGAKVINGTDVPVEPVNPLNSFYASVTRKTLKGEPEGGFEPEEKMTREQALRSYTLDAAFGAFEERIKGSLEPGKRADFTVFSKDILTVAEGEILTTEVVMTVIGGKVIYEKK